MAVKAPETKTLATIKWISEVRGGDYGDYVSLMCIYQGEGGEQKAWVDIKPDEMSMFSKNQQVHVIPRTTKKGKQKWDVELITGQPSPAAHSAPPMASQQAAPTKDQIGPYIDQMTGLYAACYRRAQGALDGAPESAIQAAASSVFISTQRKFDLA